MIGPSPSRRAVPWLWFAMAALSTLPILLSPLVMLPDLFSHIGRYHVMIDGGQDPFLARYYRFQWQLVGNLGVDLPVFLIGKMLGAELAARLVIAGIPPLSILAIYRLSGFVHGRIVPGAYLALPLIYSFPLLHGFVNYALGIALALLSLPIWLSVQRRSSWWLSIITGVMLSLLLWLVHMAAYAVFLVLIFCWTLVATIQTHGISIKDIISRILSMWPLLAPIIPTMLWRTSDSVALFGPYSLRLKPFWVFNLLRAENRPFDMLCVAILLGLLLWLLIYRRVSKQWTLLLGGFVLVALFLALPPFVFGSYYADLRLLPVALIAMFIAAGAMQSQHGRILAALGIILFVARLAETGLGWQHRGERLARDLQALDGVAEGARIASIGTRSLCQGWILSSLDHGPSLAIARKNAFVNSEWDLAGQQLLKPVYNLKAGYNSVPSNLLASASKPCDGRPMAEILAGLPRDRFDYVWIIAPEERAEHLPWLRRQFTGPQGRLYRIIQP